MRTSRSSVVMPLPVRHALRKLGRDIRDARRRRRIPAAIAAQRASISRTTLVKIEKGDPGVAIGIYATVLCVLGMADRLGDLAAPKNAPAGPPPQTHDRQLMYREALVYVDLDGVPCLMGRLWARMRKNKESAIFEYDK